MKISTAFTSYREEYMLIRGQGIRAMERCEFVGRSLVQELGGIDLNDLTPALIQEWFSRLAKTRTRGTMRGYVLQVRVVLNYFRLRGEPCLAPELIPIPKRADTVPTFLEATEVARMVEAGFDARAKFTVSLLYSSGIRLSEFLNLRRGQITNREFTILGKGGKARLCFIDERTERLMEGYLATRTDNCDYLVVSRLYQERMSASNVQLLVRETAKRAGITKHVTPHTLRHSFATNYLRNNGNLRYLQVLMGHASLETTAMYAHVVDNDLRSQYQKFHSY